MPEKKGKTPPASPVPSALLIAATALALLAIAATGAAAETTIEGQVQFENGNGGLDPAQQVDVKIRKDIVGGINPRVAQTTTNDTGHYSVSIDVAELENDDFIFGDDVLHLHVQALAQNDAVNVVNFGKNLDTANGNTYTLNREVNVTRGTDNATFDLTARSQNLSRAFRIANWTLEAYRVTEDKTGWHRNRVKARYPAALNDSAKFKSPLEKFVIGEERFDRGTVHHEYGHATMSGLFDYGGWDIPSSQFWFGTHAMWSETGTTYAWNEGFAEFYEAQVSDDPVFWVDGNWESIETYRFYNDSNYSDPDVDWGSDTGDFDGDRVEGAIASILWDVYDPADEPHDEINGSLAEIFNAVDEGDVMGPPESNDWQAEDVHEFFEQYVDNTGRHEELRKIYFEYGINKPDRFEHDPDPSTDGTILNHPTSKLDGEKWTELGQNASVDVGLHPYDDYYRVDLAEEQRVTVDATVTKKTPSGEGDLRVVVGESKAPNGSAVDDVLGTRNESYPDESVTFTAPDTSTYYVLVTDESSDRGGELTYTLTLNASPQPPQTFEQDDTRLDATELEPLPISDHVNRTTVTAATARHDPDYYELTLDSGDRIMNATLRNGPGLNLTLWDDDWNRLQRVQNGDSIDTTTDPEGTHYLVVDGDARVEGYDLTVSVQHISQKYEENDARTAAADLLEPLELDPDPARSGGTGPNHRGNRNWCDGSNAGSGTAGTGFGGGTGSVPTDSSSLSPCGSRHYWWDNDRTSAGYAPHEQDWYNVSLERHERIDVEVPDDRLGVELYADGDRVADSPAGPNTSVRYTAETGGTVYVNVTGDEYVPAHDIRVTLVDAEAHDREEVNDDPGNATTVDFPAEVGNFTETYDLLRLASGDQDHFEVTLLRGDVLNATVTHLESGGDVRLALLDPDGDVVARGSDPRDFSTSRTEVRHAEFAAEESGEHYVRVSGTEEVALKYNLTIGDRRGAEEGVESPGLAAPAALLALTLLTLYVDRRRKKG